MPATSAGAAPPGSGPRRSKRARIPRLPPDETPPRPSSLPSRRRREASPSRRSVRAREKDDLQPPVVVLDDAEVNHQTEAEEQSKQGKEIVEAEGPKEVDENAEALKEAPFWLPDGWIIHVHHDDGGATLRYYTSPVSEFTFSTEMEALCYLFSEMDEHMLESQACNEDNEIHKMSTWLPDGWLIELRAGGKMMDKMYKFFVHLPSGMRFFSKEDVLHFVNERAISRCDVKGLCDTISEDNILAQLEFNPDGLPKGWVKEVIFRKCNDGIRKHPYYTDPVSHLVFRTLKSVMSYLETGEISEHAYIPRRCVSHMYSFERCTDLPRRMLKRLKAQGTKKKSIKSLVSEKRLLDDQTSNRCQGGTSASMNPRSEPKEKEVINTMEATGKEPISAEATKRPRGRPRKTPNQANETTPDCVKGSHKKTAHIAVKKELGTGTGTGEQMSKEKAWQYHEMEKHAEDNELHISDLARSPSPSRSRPGPETDPDMLQQENGNLAEGQVGTSASMNPRSEPKEKEAINTMEATCKEPISAEATKRPRGRPRKTLKQANETTPDRVKSSHNTAHIAVKQELGTGTGTGEQMSEEKAREYHDMEKHAEDKELHVSDLARSPSPSRSRPGPETDPDMLKQENGNLAEAQDGTSASMNPRSEPKEKEVINTMEAADKEPISAETTKRPRGRPRKIPKQTNETTPDCAKSSHNKTAHIAVKKEMVTGTGTGTGEQMSEEKAQEYHDMEKLAEDNELHVSDLARSPSPSRSRPGLETDPDMFEQENGNLAEAQGGTSATMRSPRSEPKEKDVIDTMEATGKEPVSSEPTKRPRGRPRKTPKQTNETTPDCAKSLHKKTTHITVKKESATGTGEQMPDENVLENHEKEKHAMATLARSPSPRRSGRSDLVADPDLLEPESLSTAEGRANPTSSAVPIVYMRRNSNQPGMGNHVVI